MIDQFEEIILDEKEDDKFEVIDPSAYKPELEQRVSEYMAITYDLPKNNILYKHLVIPDLPNIEAKRNFWTNQFKYCMEGYNGMCGKMYFFYNFCYMENISGGKIRPEFRVVDSEWFKFVESAERSKGWGIVCVKRRRVGASWKEAADILHDCLFKKHRHIGVNSKSERDSIWLFRKVKFLYNNLPAEMRARTSASNTKMFLDFSYYVKDDKGNKLRKGNQSDIIVVAPTDSAYEGMLLTKWICDEAGKISNLPQMWSYTEDCLMEETRRVGVPIIFGTSGDVGKDGAGLREMWENSDIYKLKRFFFGGWTGLAVDELGNDRREDCIRWIVYKRKEKERLSAKYQNDFVQKYPLSVEEAFNSSDAFGMGDPIKIKAQRSSLVLNPPQSSRGTFRQAEDGSIVFAPSASGECIIYEHPVKDGRRDAYIAACDPADMDDVTGDVSDLATYILSTRNGLSRPKIVFEYSARPKELNNYYQQALYALLYYNNARILIERQKGGRMISFFSDRGAKNLLMWTPQDIRRFTSTAANTIGIHMTPDIKNNYGPGVVAEYIDNDYDTIPSIKLLDELLVYGTKNTDRAMAFMIAVIALKEISKPIMNINNRFGKDSRLPKITYIKNNNGRIERVLKSK